MTSERAHRMAPKRGPVQAVARLLLLQLLAVIGIAAAITAVAAAVGPDHDDDDVRAVTPAGSGSSSTPGGTQTTAPPTTTAPASTTPPVSTSPATTLPGVPAPVKVDVLNQSAPQGSASRVADRLRQAGWKIGRVDDFHGNVSETTVYWLDREQRRQARQVSRFLGGVRVEEGFDTLVEGRVSVVLVD